MGVQKCTKCHNLKTLLRFENSVKNAADLFSQAYRISSSKRFKIKITET